MKKILVIEDNRSIRESILGLLHTQGFNALGAENGAQGTQVAKDYLPDMILCDVVMPEMDGYGVLETLRRNPHTAAIPFIFLTSMSAKESYRHGMELGADDYLTKPCTPEELLGAITSRFSKQAVLARQSQRQLDTLRNSIAFSLPHELRTPLNGILGLTEVLMEEADTIERAEVIDIAQGIHNSAERLYRLTQNFLLYAELELMAGDRDRTKTLRMGETHYPKILVADVATKIATKADRTEDLQLNLQNMRVWVSDFHLKKIVEELTDNAFKFSKPGTPVSLTTIAGPHSLRLRIVDQGRGMTNEQITSLGAYIQFERKLYEQQGTGLGLAIAKRLTELHGGDLTIDSAPGGETIVEVRLPGGDREFPLDH